LKTSISYISRTTPSGCDEDDDEIDEVFARFIDEEPAVVMRGVRPETTELLRYMVRTMSSSNVTVKIVFLWHRGGRLTAQCR
jgi:hypothetical protein